MRDLTEIREDINEVDTQMRALYLKRMSLAQEVAKSKEQTGDQIFKPEREEEILKLRATDMDDELRLKYISYLKALMRSSREYQYSELLRRDPDKFPLKPQTEAIAPRTVYYQGLPGAYQELAASELFPNAAIIPVSAFEDVFTAVHDGIADAGVVPVENTTAGTVNEVYDLLAKHQLYINASCTKKIHHCLAAVLGATISDVKTVCSHPHALPQCKAFIDTHGFVTQEVPNTAVAAKQVAERQDKSFAAICSEEAAKRYGLTVLQSNINDMSHNETRFIGISPTLTALPSDNRIEIAFHILNVAGSLYNVLGIFADYGIDMTEIHSRPIRNSPWSYIFYIDFVGSLFDHAIRALLSHLHEELPYLKILGSYRVADASGGESHHAN